MCLEVHFPETDDTFNFQPPESHIRDHAYFLWEQAGKPTNKDFWAEAVEDCQYAVFYKVVINFAQTLFSPIILYTWKQGWNESDRATQTPLSWEMDYSYGGLSAGIHVFTELEDAETAARVINGVVIPVHCYKKDFVAGGVINTPYWTVRISNDPEQKKYTSDSRKVTKNNAPSAVLMKVFVPELPPLPDFDWATYPEAVVNQEVA